MIRKFNYTNRQKIPRERINISIKNIGSSAYFIATVDTDGMLFPDTAKVYIEPYYGPNYLRFDFGNYNSISQPSNTDISELKRISEKIYFRIKIVDESHENGLLLGYADKIPLADDGEPEGKTSLLYVNAVKMETNEIWRVDFRNSEDGMPILEVNNSIDGIKEMAKNDPVFFALIYPSVIRQILNSIIDSNDFDSYGDSWSSKWIKFTQDVLSINTTPEKKDDEEKCEEWINDVVKSFCTRYKTLENYRKILPL